MWHQYKFICFLNCCNLYVVLAFNEFKLLHMNVYMSDMYIYYKSTNFIVMQKLETERKGATDSASKLKAEAEELKEMRVKLLSVEGTLEDTKKQLAAKTVQMEQLVSSLIEVCEHQSY